MNILVTLNSNYIVPLCTMLYSLVKTNGDEHIELFVVHSSLTKADFTKMEFALAGGDYSINDIKLDDSLFADAPSEKRISKETYYRMFAPLYLPETVDRVLYIDPDTVVINSLNEFYNADFQGKSIIGAKHFTGLIDLWNRGRLFIYKAERYINAGVMLLNIEKMRKSFDKNDVFKIIKKYQRILFLADQDAINIMYEGDIRLYSEYKINLDERTFAHLLKKHDLATALDMVRTDSVIIHFNGKYKPWHDNYKGYLGEFFETYNKEVMKGI